MAVLLKRDTLISIFLIHFFPCTSILFKHSSLALLFMATIFLNQDSLTYCLLILSFSVTVTFKINQFLCYNRSRYLLEPVIFLTHYYFDRNQVKQVTQDAGRCERLAAGIANIKYSLTLRVMRPINGILLSCTLSVIWLFLYVYNFIALSLATMPLSLWVTAVFTYMPFLSSLLSWLFTSNRSLILDDLVVNFASLTLYAQATMYFLKPLC